MSDLAATNMHVENMAGRSPAGMNFMGNMPGGDFVPQMFTMDKNQMQMGPGPQGMRPPTSNADMAAMRAQGGRPNQFQGGQPMQQQGSQAGQQIGTPNNRDMPPPQAPAGGSAQRNQGGSPGNNAPPTPSQASKPNPKGNKKGAAKEERKVRTETDSNRIMLTYDSDLERKHQMLVQMPTMTIRQQHRHLRRQ